jgi:hypothetical protein
MTADWTEVEGVVNKDRLFTITEGEVAKNLAGYTITVKVWSKGSSLKFSGTCNIVDAATGAIKYRIISADMAVGTKGEDYLFSFHCKKGTEELLTIPKTLEILEGPPSS